MLRFYLCSWNNSCNMHEITNNKCLNRIQWSIEWNEIEIKQLARTWKFVLNNFAQLRAKRFIMLFSTPLNRTRCQSENVGSGSSFGQFWNGSILLWACIKFFGVEHFIFFLRMEFDNAKVVKCYQISIDLQSFCDLRLFEPSSKALKKALIAILQPIIPFVNHVSICIILS